MGLSWLEISKDIVMATKSNWVKGSPNVDRSSRGMSKSTKSHPPSILVVKENPSSPRHLNEITKVQNVQVEQTTESSFVGPGIDELRTLMNWKKFPLHQPVSIKPVPVNKKIRQRQKKKENRESIVSDSDSDQRKRRSGRESKKPERFATLSFKKKPKFKLDSLCCFCVIKYFKQVESLEQQQKTNNFQNDQLCDQEDSVKVPWCVKRFWARQELKRRSLIQSCSTKN